MSVPHNKTQLPEPLLADLQAAEIQLLSIEAQLKTQRASVWEELSPATPGDTCCLSTPQIISAELLLRKTKASLGRIQQFTFFFFLLCFAHTA